MPEKVFVIAEAGVNHNGSLELAKRMVDEALAFGADAIKFQSFKAKNLVTKFAKKAEYQKQNELLKENESQFLMLKRLELSESEQLEIFNYCNKKNICFLSSPFDLESIDFLDSLGLKIFKIPSGEITNLPYLEKIAKLCSEGIEKTKKTEKKIILSTGMSEVSDIKNAIEVLTSNKMPLENIILLHANTEYPTPMSDVNLRAMNTLRDIFNVNVGYSDHTEGIEISIAAVALGATVIEKHFTLDKNMEGPDHKASLEPEEFARLVKSIRNIEQALGSPEKKASESEKKNLLIARKSIVASKEIKAGEIFTKENLSVKRPGTGISPMRWYEILGKKAQKDFQEDELIKFE